MPTQQFKTSAVSDVVRQYCQLLRHAVHVYIGQRIKHCRYILFCILVINVYTMVYNSVLWLLYYYNNFMLRCYHEQFTIVM